MFDLTDFSGLRSQGRQGTTPTPQPAAPQQPTTPTQTDAEKIAELEADFARVGGPTSHQRKIEENHKNELPGAWRIDKFTEDGQVVAGEVDDEQKKFSSETTIVE